MNILISHLSLFLFPLIILARTPFAPAVQQQVELGIEKTIRNDFVGAEALFRELIAAYPDQPAGYFYLGATFQAEMLDAEQYDRLEEFQQTMARCIEVAKALQERDGSDPWPYFFEGSAHLYRSFMDSKQKKMLGAYRNAVRGVHRLEKVIALDSAFYDAYLGVGSFKYWKSSKAKALTWLPFISDERRRGIEMVQIALEKGNFVKLVGRDQLAWMLLDAGRTQEALELALQNHRLYPESRFFRWTLVEIYYRGEHWEEAFQAYGELLQMVRALPENNHYNEITCLLRLGEIYCLQGEFEKSRDLALEILRLPLDPQVRERAKPKLKQALELQKRCAEELARAG